MQPSSQYIEVSKQYYHEDYGLYYDDFTVGDTIKHWPGRTLTEVDNIWQSLLCMNTHPLHFDSVYASKMEFKKPLISSAVTFSIVNGLTVRTISAKAIANLGWNKVRLLAPVFAGDTIYAETSILAKRLSRSRQDAGIVKVFTKGITSVNKIFMTFERTVLVPKK